MTYKEMLPLMGQIVTVRTTLRRYHEGNYGRVWRSVPCHKPWAGWVVGFRHKHNGTVDHPFYHAMLGKSTPFTIISSIPCMMVAPCPTMNAIPVPLDGYELGGKPEPPDNGGWRSYKAFAKEPENE